MSSQYDFDTIIDRHHTGAMKTDVLCERYGREDLIPVRTYCSTFSPDLMSGEEDDIRPMKSV